jgi:hypothetical protein
MIAVIAEQIATLAQTCNLKGTSLSLNAKLIETLSEPARTTYSELNTKAIDDCSLESPAPVAANVGESAPQQQQQAQVAPQATFKSLRQRTPPRTTAEIAPAPPPPMAEEQVQQVQQQMANARGAFVLRGKEIDVASKGGRIAAAGTWYAVLSSYADGEEEYVVDDVAKFTKRIGELAGAPAFRLEVYRTKISKHFAVVLRPEAGQRDAARDLAAKARELGFASDAFVQEDRGWMLCGSPSSVDQLKTCAAKS